MAILKLQKQLKALDAYEKHQVQITNMFAAIKQRKDQLVTQRAQMEVNGTFDQDDLDLVDELIAYIDARYTHIS